MRKVLLLLFTALASCCAFAQTQATMTVNGATDPGAIPSTSAYTAVFVQMATTTQTTLAQKVALVGFTAPTDATAFTVAIQYFASQIPSQQNGNSLESLEATTYSTKLSGTLTALGKTQLDTFVYAQRSKMALWTDNTSRGGCTQGSMVTLQDWYWLQDIDDPNDDGQEIFGEAYDNGNCTCSDAPTGSTLTFDGPEVQGVTTKVLTTVSHVATTGSVTGILLPASLTFNFKSACSGAWYIPIAIQAELAYTLTQYTGGPRGPCYTNNVGQVFCAYPVQNWCSPATTPPDDDYTGWSIDDTTVHGYWGTVAICGRIVGLLGGHSGWACSKGAAIGLDGSYNKGSCTSNP